MPYDAFGAADSSGGNVFVKDYWVVGMFGWFVRSIPVAILGFVLGILYAYPLGLLGQPIPLATALKDGHLEVGSLGRVTPSISAGITAQNQHQTIANLEKRLGELADCAKQIEGQQATIARQEESIACLQFNHQGCDPSPN